MVFQNGVRVENLVSENYHLAKALIDKYNVDKKQISNVVIIHNEEQFQKGKYSENYKKFKLILNLAINIFQKIKSHT